MPKMPGGDEKKEESAESKEEAAEQVIIRFICCSLKETQQMIYFFYIFFIFRDIWFVHVVALSVTIWSKASSQICPTSFFRPLLSYMAYGNS
jgi:hypothetical protein